MKIMRLKSENVKRLGVVEITPDGNLIVIGGKNGAGKSSVLDSIWYALGGGRATPSDPIRHGKRKAEVSVTIGNGEALLHVTRTWTSKGASQLEVKNDKGAIVKSPQSILDALFGSLTFDPLAFAQMKAADQINTLKQLTGLNLEEIEGKRDAAYAERTQMGRELRQAEANLESATYHQDAPESHTTIDQLITEQREAQGVLTSISDLTRNLAAVEQEIQKINATVSERRASIIKLAAAVSDKTENARELKSQIDNIQAPDIEKYDEQIRNAEANNQKVRENEQHGRLVKRLGELTAGHATLTDKIEDLDEQKVKMVEDTKMPVEGLAFGDGAVLYQDVPLDQSSSAERLRVSVAIGLAMNPKLKVLLIRDGSLLDEENLAMIGAMAEKADAQLWIERVGKGDECSVIIEDGNVLKDAPKSTEEVAHA